MLGHDQALQVDVPARRPHVQLRFLLEVGLREADDRPCPTFEHDQKSVVGREDRSQLIGKGLDRRWLRGDPESIRKRRNVECVKLVVQREQSGRVGSCRRSN